MPGGIPGTIWLHGRYLDFKGGGTKPVVYEPYELYRVQPRDHPNGHQADGKIRVSAYKDGKPTMQVAFDGAATYDMNGPTGEGADAPFWRLTMGFGMIRFALDPDYRLERLADDLVDGQPSYTVRVTDPSGGSSLFSVRQSDARNARIFLPRRADCMTASFPTFSPSPASNGFSPVGSDPMSTALKRPNSLIPISPLEAR